MNNLAWMAPKPTPSTPQPGEWVLRPTPLGELSVRGLNDEMLESASVELLTDWLCLLLLYIFPQPVKKLRDSATIDDDIATADMANCKLTDSKMAAALFEIVTNDLPFGNPTNRVRTRFDAYIAENPQQMVGISSSKRALQFSNNWLEPKLYEAVGELVSVHCLDVCRYTEETHIAASDVPLAPGEAPTFRALGEDLVWHIAMRYFQTKRFDRTAEKRGDKLVKSAPTAP